MLFTIGFCMFFICSVAIGIRDNMHWYWWGWFRNFLGFTALFGFLMMVISGLLLAWEYLP